MITPEELKILKSFAERIPDNDPGAHNNLAIVYYNKGLYEEAIEELEKAIKIDPNFVLARNNLDIILKKTGRLEQRVEKLARILDEEPYDEQKTLELADTYRKLNRHSQAIIFYRKVLDLNPGSFEAHYGLGTTLKLLGKYDDALEEIKQALEIKISPEVYRVLGEIYFNKGVIDLAIKNFQESLTLDPSSAEGHFMLGFALGEKGKLEESLHEVRKAIELNPALAQFEPNLPINIEKHKGHWEFLKEQLGIPKPMSNEYQVHYNMGISYRNKGLFNEAKREFEECLKTKVENPDLFYALGQVNIFLKKYDESLEFLQRAFDKDFDSAPIANALGVVYLLQEQFENALGFFEKALSLNKEFPGALNNLAVVHIRLKKFEKASTHFKKAIELGSIDARFNLGMYHLKKQKYEQALEIFTEEDGDGCFGRGIALMELGKDEEALTQFKKAIEFSPGHAGAHYNIGFILTKSGNYEEGLEHIRKGMEIEPNYEKNRYRLFLAPEFTEFGPYYFPKVKTEEGVAVSFEEIFPPPEVPGPEDYLNGAKNYLASKEYDMALEKLEKALALKPDWNEAVALKAEVFYHYGNVDDALEVLQSYLNRHPQDKKILKAKADIFEYMDRLKDAREVYQKLLEIDPDDLKTMNRIADILFN